MPHYAKPSNGFTLIELLVVVSIIGLLIALLLPALAMANNSAKAINTLSAMQQTVVAYSTYSVDHKDQLLPGYLTDTFYGQPVSSTLNGVTFFGQGARRYPTRLAEYQGDSWEMIYNHTAPPEVPSPSDPDFYTKAYQLGLSPAFGMNTAFVGGDYRYAGFASIGGVNRPNPNGPAVSTQQQVKTPSSLIAFTETSEFSGGEVTELGHHAVVAPIHLGLREWSAAGDGFEYANAFGKGVPTGRFVDAVATGFIDGHCEAAKPTELDDMRLWSNFAKTINDPGLTR